MPRMPTLSSQRRRSGKPRAMFVLLGLLGIGAGTGYLWHEGRIEVPWLPAEQALLAPATVAIAPRGESAPLAAAAPVASLDEQRAQSGLRLATIRINGPLETSVVNAVGREVGLALAQVINRALVWWVEIPGDLRRGDTVDVLFQQVPGAEPAVHALRFTSGKAAQTFSAYRFGREGQKYARYYQGNGEELELTLAPSPIDGYEQITSLIRDGRRHQGVDFKAAVGTPVRATFDGVVSRKNWGFRRNGNCLEITESGTGRKALYLHLDKIPASTRVGDRVSVGQVLADSGNSGRSFAPHLHYQLMTASGRILDPFEVHGASRNAMSGADADALKAEIARLDGLMAPSVSTH